LRLAFSLFVAAGFVLAALATLLGLAADRFPWLELFNHFRPFMLAGAVVLLALAAFTRRRDLIILCALLAFANAALFTLVLQGKAEAAPEGSQRFLRVIALNLWTRNQEIDKVIKFLANSEADVISLSELRSSG
jgi:endonuclease/exonuclease/phosphatase (EEP) superfamily protein YafD